MVFEALNTYMDPLSALSVAANVVQFVQVGGELVSRAVKFYRSSSGLLRQHEELLTSAETLKQDTQALLDGGELSGSVERLVNSCHELAAELIAILHELKPRSGNRKWEAVRQTVRTAYRDSAINSLIERMRLLRDGLNTHLLVTLKYVVGSL